MEQNSVLSTKRCSKCGEEKAATVTYFSRNRTRKDGLHPHCKQCVHIWQQNNKQHINMYMRQYRRTWMVKRAKIKHYRDDEVKDLEAKVEMLMQALDRSNDALKRSTDAVTYAKDIIRTMLDDVHVFSSFIKDFMRERHGYSEERANILIDTVVRSLKLQ